ncbi:MAG: DUF92 domain-containing protein [Nannocystaceae bacterium]
MRVAIWIVLLSGALLSPAATWLAIVVCFVLAGFRRGQIGGLAGADTGCDRSASWRDFYTLLACGCLLLAGRWAPAIAMTVMWMVAHARLVGACWAPGGSGPIVAKPWQDGFTTTQVLGVWGGLAAIGIYGFAPLWAWQTGETLSAATAWVLGFATANVGTLAYTFSKRGSGLLGLAVAAAWSLALLVRQDLAWSVAAMGFAWVIGGFSLRLRLLSGGGAVAAALLGSLLFATLGAAGAVPLLGFFIASSGLSKLAKRRRPEVAKAAEKGTQRDGIQVFANAGISLVCAGCMALFDAPGWYFAVVAGLAAATADTWATEIGSFSNRRPVDILRWTPVSPGQSGGITLLGTLGAFAGSTFATALGWMFIPGADTNVWVFVGLVAAGVGGSLVDSILGCTWQARYRVLATGASSEAASTNGQPNTLVRGWRWMTNDTVNLLCTAAGAGLGGLVWWLA